MRTSVSLHVRLVLRGNLSDRRFAVLGTNKSKVFNRQRNHCRWGMRREDHLPLYLGFLLRILETIYQMANTVWLKPRLDLIDKEDGNRYDAGLLDS